MMAGATRSLMVAAAMACLCIAEAAAGSPAYDGVYHGDVTRTRGDDFICGKASYQVSYTVVNGQFSIPYDLTHHVGVNLEVQQDGTFSGSQQYQVGQKQSQVRASGRIVGNVMDAAVEGFACARSYHLTKG